MTNLAGRNVLVTGIGREGQVGEVVGRALAAAGASLVVVDLLRDIVEARISDLRGRGARVTGFSCDLTSESDVARLTEEVAGAVASQLHAVVNLAGGFGESKVDDGRLAIWRKQLDLNLTTAVLTTAALLPMLRNTQGSLVYFGSAAALPGASVANLAAYASAKGGVLTLMRAVAEEERQHGVRANAIAPTSIRTAANEKSMGAGARYVEREDVARMVAWLCSDDSRPVTGQVIALG
jgi:NAD(P)-dependent dehydrogenase (short-subunit alcohol dehydrogenase family)